MAAMVNASATVEVLLKAGADARAKDNKGVTPLHAAAVANASATVEDIARGGSRCQRQNHMTALRSMDLATGIYDLTIAEILLKAGADANAKVQ